MLDVANAGGMSVLDVANAGGMSELDVANAGGMSELDVANAGGIEEFNSRSLFSSSQAIDVVSRVGRPCSTNNAQK